MSIQFDWDKLVEDSEAIENHICEFLHDQFQQIHLPPFIQSLAVTSFKLGSKPPELTLRHFSDPFREFYEEDEDSSNAGTPLPSVPLLYPGLMSSSRMSREDTLDDSMEGFNSLSDGSMGSIDSSAEIPTTSPASHASYEETPREDRPLDVQTLVEFKYAGDMQLALSATLLVNYPAPSFISLPLAIRVTGIEIHTLAVAAYIAPRIHLSILCDIAGDDQTPAASEEVDVIKAMKIESEIGDNSNHGAVLRNVGKVEKFVLEQLRRVIREEVVWPGWITLEL